MGATPLYLAIILVRAKAYSRAIAMLCVSDTVYSGFHDFSMAMVFTTKRYGLEVCYTFHNVITF